MVYVSVQVLEVRAKQRTGQDNFVSVMRKAVGARYGESPVGLGGVFQITAGKAKLHIMVSIILHSTYCVCISMYRM